MTLCSMAAQGRDIKLSAQRVEGYRNFITKIWNAIKFCEINKCKNLGLDIAQSKNTFNVWILNELDVCEQSVSLAVKNYKFNEAANTLYKFTWNIFCDWYFEFSKSVFFKDQEKVLKHVKLIGKIKQLVINKFFITQATSKKNNTLIFLK